MSSFQSLVQGAIDNNALLSSGDKVLVALSGGADSVSLFHILLKLQDKYNLEIMACHINHNLRGDEAKRDESFVRQLCNDNNVQLFVKSIDVETLAKQQKISTELCGRNVRYEFFSELHNKYNCKVATAHTASDNAETIIFNLSRGASLKGLCGIVPKRDYIIRPLIYCTRSDVEGYCNENNFQFVTDSTNLTDDYTRNKIRHSIIPLIKELNPSFEKTAVKNSTGLLEIQQYIDRLSDKELANSRVDNGYDIDYLSKLDIAIKKAVLNKIIKENSGNGESCHIDALVKLLNTGGFTDIPPHKRAIAKQGVLRFINNNEAIQDFKAIKFEENLEFTYNNKQYSVKEIKLEGNKPLLSKDILKLNPIFRTRQTGDTFALPYRNVTKSLKKLFNEKKIPQEKRDSLMLLASGSNILWCENIGISAHMISHNGEGFNIIVDKLTINEK